MERIGGICRVVEGGPRREGQEERGRWHGPLPPFSRPRRVRAAWPRCVRGEPHLRYDKMENLGGCVSRVPDTASPLEGTLREEGERQTTLSSLSWGSSPHAMSPLHLQPSQGLPGGPQPASYPPHHPRGCPPLSRSSPCSLAWYPSPSWKIVVYCPPPQPKSPHSRTT